ncbi:MAG: hypothetical protein ACR2KQ_04160 [Actinomycetota bacterium]
MFDIVEINGPRTWCHEELMTSTAEVEVSLISHLDDDLSYVGRAVELVEKANAGLEPALLSVAGAKAELERYVRLRRMADFGIAALAARIDDAEALAKTAGTSLGQAKDTIATGAALKDSDILSGALQTGAVSLEQAGEIAKAETSAPGAAAELVTVAQESSFQVLREKARKVALEAEQHRGLAERQRSARSGRPYTDPLGMVHIHLALEPHVGTPIVARAEAEAARLYRSAKAAAKGSREAGLEPFERYLADAFVKMLAGGGKASTTRPELVVLVSHEVAKRGWSDVRDGEVCKIPGVGPVSPEVAREIAGDAFLSGVFFDGTDLRHFKRWSRNIPVEVRVALELGRPPGFDGRCCSRCGNRFRPQIDHVEPYCAGNPSSLGNSDDKCWACHLEKTEADRKAGKLRRTPGARPERPPPQDPDPPDP